MTKRSFLKLMRMFSYLFQFQKVQNNNSTQCVFSFGDYSHCRLGLGDKER